MPILYEASRDPRFVGLYVDLFFDPPGRLSRIRIINQGEGYDPNDPPTINITGEGTGAVILPTIIGANGNIKGIQFKRDPNLGEFRGEGYLTTVPTFTTTSTIPPTIPAEITSSLSINTSLLNRPDDQFELLRFCVENDINFLLVDSLKYMDWSQSATTNSDAPGTAALRNFLQRARNAGIEKISAVINGSKYEVDQLYNFQINSVGADFRFDAVTFKREYWQGYGTFQDFIYKLNYLKIQNDLLLSNYGPTYYMELQTWLGWFTQAEAEQIIPLSNRILLDDFSPTRVPDFKYMENRLETLADAAVSIGTSNIRLYPIFSSERILDDWNGSNEFMGEFFTEFNLKDAWYKWARIPGGSHINNLSLGAFNSHASQNVGDNLNPRGLVCYNYSNARRSLGEASPCLARIEPVGPIYATPGDEIILSVSNIGNLTTPSGMYAVSYLWSNAETGTTITATTNGSYSVDVTYSNSCVATSNVVDIYFEECHAYIDYEGPLVLNQNEGITLTGSSGNSWTWYRDNGSGFSIFEIGEKISVSYANVGDFFVEIDNGSGCIQSSSTITILRNLNEDCNVTITSETPLFYASASTYSSVTVSVYPNTGSNYIWSDGENGQTREISETGYYRVSIVNGSCLTNATSEYFFATGTYSPIDQIWTDDNYPAFWNSTLRTPENQTNLFWTEYNFNLTNINSEKFYAFFKMRSLNGKRTGVRFALNKTNNFIPITGVASDILGWYKIEVDSTGLTQIVQQRNNKYYLQLINMYCEITEVLITEDANLVPGPYPNFTYPL